MLPGCCTKSIGADLGKRFLIFMQYSSGNSQSKNVRLDVKQLFCLWIRIDQVCNTLYPHQKGESQMRFTLKAILGVVVLVAATGAVYAQFSKPDDAIAYRKAVMVLIVHHFKQMGAMVQGKAEYDKIVFEDNAKLVQTLSAMPWEAFLTPGSDKGDTDMKASALSDTDAFSKTAKDFENATKALALAAAGGDSDAVKAAFGKTAQSCKACHGPFRK
jgi:cytochrome c556